MKPSPLETGSNTPSASRFWQEWLGHSLHFPILNILLEVLVSDPIYYLISPNLVGLLLASALQAWALSRWQGMDNPRRLLGNLIGPATFTAIGASLMGFEFLSAPNHIAYWVFGLLFGAIQSMQPTARNWLHALFVLGEALLSGAMVAVMYYILHARLDPVATMRIPNFLLEPGNLFVVLAFLLLGLYSGLANLSAWKSLGLAQETKRKLMIYADWLFGRDPQGGVIEVPPAQAVKREERIILVMEIRGLAQWGEARQPEETVSLLNRYYQTAEATLNQHHALRIKYRAGEALALFERVDDALEAALKLRLQINALLHRHGLGVGFGLHSGSVLEGWLGGKDVKVMDVVGEAVEIARQVEANAGPGELLVSESMRIAIGTTFRAGPKRVTPIWGRDEPIVIYPLE